MKYSEWLRKRIKTLERQLATSRKNYQKYHKHRYVKNTVVYYVDSGETYDTSFVKLVCNCGKVKNDQT